MSEFMTDPTKRPKWRTASERRKSLRGKAEGQGFAVERSETFETALAGETTLKSVRTPVTRTLRVLNVSALRASTLETHLRFPPESL